ncbi:hypothetical protein DV515_00015872 [Chloebia gouldiae]|uniref:Uncharacterized protein n=1 Tax=Chloebia gouldiae TaxID=44316 RepID=A0A3L8RTZ7_CHLGU|nr:hypothetical protein DV515_00015872 [Chloebia gouldiae]
MEITALLLLRCWWQQDQKGINPLEFRDQKGINPLGYRVQGSERDQSPRVSSLGIRKGSIPSGIEFRDQKRINPLGDQKRINPLGYRVQGSEKGSIPSGIEFRDQKRINPLGYRVQGSEKGSIPSGIEFRDQKRINPLGYRVQGSERDQSPRSEASENSQLSDKTDLAPSEDSQSLLKTEPLEKVLNEISKEMNNFARIALDSSYIQELDEILKEARAIEKHLKEKREKLKQRFAVIANSLQS